MSAQEIAYPPTCEMVLEISKSVIELPAPSKLRLAANILEKGDRELALCILEIAMREVRRGR